MEMNQKLSFTIKNFRNIIDVSINIWPEKINFIVGDNNIGKSNILDAISMMSLVNSGKSKFIWNRDTPSIPKDNDTEIITEISVSYELPKDYIWNKFSNINIKPCDLDTLKNKFIKNFSYYYRSQIKTDGLNGSYSKLFVDEELEKTYASQNSNVRDELVNETYPNFIKIKGTDNLENCDQIDFTYQQLLDMKNIAFVKLYEFVCAFAKDQNQAFSWLDLLMEIKSPVPNNLSGEPLKRHRSEINKKKSIFLKEINENILNLYKGFTNLHCKLVIDLTETNNINIFIKTDDNFKFHALSYGLQGNGVKKLINLIYLLQFCKNQDRKYIFLIDEIEESLSINSQISLINYLKKFLKDNKNVYLLIVTHAPAFFDLKENEKYSDYMYLNLCTQNKDGSINIENIFPDNIITENTGYEAKNGKNAFDGVRFLSIALDMPDKISKKVINK